MSDFDLARFYDLTDEIEDLLGILSGNNAVKDWWGAYQDSLGDRPRVAQGLGYISQPSDMSYSVQFLFHGHPGDTTEEQLNQIMTDAYEAADQCFQNGVKWAAGIAGYLRDICASFTRADADRLKGAAQDLANVRVELEAAVPADWTDLVLTEWIGESRNEFWNFYTELHDKGQEYVRYFAYAEAWFAAAAAIAVQTQNGLIDLLEGVRDNLRSQLEQWVETNGSPYSFGPHDNPIPEIASFVGDVVGLVPAVGGTVTSVRNVVSKTAALIGMIDTYTPSIEQVSFTLESAEAVYTTLTTTLHDDFLKAFNDGMDRLASERSGPVLAQVDELVGRGQWFPDPVPGASSPDWQHSTEG